jgi:N-acetylmuramoyl-L-alanine amidase
MRLFTLLLLSIIALPSAAATRVDGIRIWPAPDHTRLVLDTAGPVDHNVFALSGPSRLVIDLKDTALKADFDAVSQKRQ